MPRRSPEADFQKEVVRLARLMSWRVFYIPDWMYRLAMASMKRMRKGDRDWPDHGFPDLVMLKGRRLIFAELKAGRNKPTKDQLGWHEDIRAVEEIGMYVWNDSRDMDEVIRVLTRS